MTEPDLGLALAAVAGELGRLDTAYAVVGGFAVSLRAEVRFTRDLDLAIDVARDLEVESLVRDLRGRGYGVIALVEHDAAKRIATVRLRSPSGITIDLLAASSGIEAEIVGRASSILVEGVGTIPVAQAEDLLAMKVLSMDGRRLQDRIDAIRLIELNADLDEARVRDDLRLIRARGFHRDQDLDAKLAEILAIARTP
jgi:hypothetical protein